MGPRFCGAGFGRDGCPTGALGRPDTAGRDGGDVGLFGGPGETAPEVEGMSTFKAMADLERTLMPGFKPAGEVVIVEPGRSGNDGGGELVRVSGCEGDGAPEEGGLRVPLSLRAIIALLSL